MIFEYGVSDPGASVGADRDENNPDRGHRGQGLFVAKTYMAKMGGTIVAENLPDGRGVRFTLALPKAT